MTLRFLACATVAGTLSFASFASAAAQPAAVDASSEQALVADFLAAVNGDEPARAAFLTAHVSEKPRMPTAEFPAALQTIARTSGGLKLLSSSWRGGDLRLIVESSTGKAARVDLMLESKSATRLSGLRGVAIPAPYAGPKVTAPVSRSELAAAIDQRIRSASDRDDFSGAVLVVKGDEVIYSGAFGEADKAAHKPVRLDTRFNLGSMDKQFTAVAIGQLIEQGRLTLDTRLVDVLPDYPNPEAARKITIRHLLSHSAGLGMLFERKGWDWKLRYNTMSELLPLFAKQPLEFEPGTRGSYANEGFIVLGAVIEKLSGETWYDYVQAHVFAPAGMTHTAYLTDDPAAPDRAIGYKFGDDDPLGLGARRPNWDTLSRRGNSCGGGFSTVGDMIKFLQALRSGKLLKPETVAVFTAQAPNGQQNYGFGFMHIPTGVGRTIVGHDGGGPGSGVNSDAKMVWETGYAYAVLGNYDSPFAQTVGRDIGDMLAVQN